MQLIDNKLIKDISDIFYLKRNSLAGMDRMGEKSINNLINSIMISKETYLWRFIHGLGIRNIGENTSKILGRRYEKIEKLFYLNLEDLTQIEEIGDISAEAVIDFFNNSHNINMINKCIKAGLIFKKLKSIKNDLEGINFAITGTLSIPRNDMKSKLESLGAKIVSSISSKTNYLICGNNPGQNKINKANQFKIESITEDDALKIIND
jgi:DNA ligase (NAD+)